MTLRYFKYLRDLESLFQWMQNCKERSFDDVLAFCRLTGPLHCEILLIRVEAEKTLDEKALNQSFHVPNNYKYFKRRYIKEWAALVAREPLHRPS